MMCSCCSSSAWACSKRVRRCSGSGGSRQAGPKQPAYEVMRTCVLFGQSPAERARQTGLAARSLYRMVECFDRLGMANLFAPIEEAPRRGPSLSPALRQLIVDPKAEYPALHLRESAQMCYVKEGRRPSPGTIQRVLADGPPPT